MTDKPTNTFYSRQFSMLHPYTASQVAQEYWHHRSPWMEEKLTRITNFFHTHLGKKYTPLIITTTEHGALEAIVANVVSEKDMVWVPALSAWETVAHSFSTHVETITTNSTQLPTHAPSLVLLDDVTQNGEKSDFLKIAHTVKRKYPKTLIVVNLSTSFGADTLTLSKAGIDACVIVPERGLAGIPGLTLIACTTRFFAAIETCRKIQITKPYTFDLLKYRKSWEKHDTPYSPDVSASVGLNAALEVIAHNGGFKKHLDRQHFFATCVRTYLKKLGYTMRASEKRATSAFTRCTVPATVDRSKLISFLSERDIALDTQPENTYEILFGHTGYVTAEHLQKLLEALYTYHKKQVPKEIYTAEYPELTPPTHSGIDSKVFTIPVSDWQAETVKKTKALKDATLIEKVITSGEAVFSDLPLHHNCFLDRHIGFIGAGNTVREAINRCQKLGITRISVYSPSLAAQKKKRGADVEDIDNHRSIAYWEHRNIRVCSDAETIFLESHTVVLLPTFYTKKSAQLLGKDSIYINKHMVNNALLSKVEREGVMDLLINASAREGLLDRHALSKHIQKGWLRYHSDETPSLDDPVSTLPTVRMTAHVGGSSRQPQRAVALNTRTILTQLVRSLRGPDHTKKPLRGYRMNIVNTGLIPKNTERTATIPKDTPCVRILITDTFDLSTLNLVELEKNTTVPIEVRDISHDVPTDTLLLQHIREFEPHLMMVRTRTRITHTVARALKQVPHFVAVVRPGVGVDNIYDGIQILSKAGILVINEPYGNSFSVGEMAIHFSIRGIERMILTPGPTRYNADVFSAAYNYTHPNSESYTKILSQIQKQLRQWIHLGVGPVILSTPSTGFMEAAITNLTSIGDRGMVVAHGKFGNRFKEISLAAGREVLPLEVTDATWGSAFSPTVIKKALAADKKAATRTNTSLCTYLTLQLNETSTGVAYTQKQLEAIVQYARAYNPDILIILDGVSGVFAHHIDVSALALDVIVVGSQKGLGVSSGITYSALSARATKKLLEHAGYTKSFTSFSKETSAVQAEYIRVFEQRQRVSYLNYLRIVTANTLPGLNIPSIFHVLATGKALALITATGKDTTIEKCITYARRTRAVAQKHALRILSDTAYRSNSVTPICLPPEVAAPELRKAMELQYGILVSGAQSDYWKPSLIRIGHLGFVSHEDTVRCLRALEIILRQLTV